MSAVTGNRVIVGEDSEEESDEARELSASKVDSEGAESDEENQEDSIPSDEREEASDDGNEEMWKEIEPRLLSGSLDGLCMIQKAMMQKIRPSMETAIERIQELMENQKAARNVELLENECMEKIESTMTKSTAYAQKIDRIAANMMEISIAIERMKKKADDLRIDAQSYAIKKEEKREERQQWNLFYAAKSSESVSSD
ncbi:unnamed protein product [Albugo candida]|uniref:Biogenesis of lysosome-related organelles complex 1 subunit 6 n=1 Tax=Albugo candida TaxID=65357 RepID=A0A024GI06_9STRA|nr:unnamed protein product [Albugo candida]|eukprot:CCI45958.1 unnamed protein product [Albugo candida]